MEGKKIGPLDKFALFLKNLFGSNESKTIFVPKPAAPPPPKPRARVVALDPPPTLAWDDAASVVQNLFAGHANDVFASVAVVLDSLAARMPGSAGPDPLSAPVLPIRDGANIAILLSPSFLARLPESVQYEVSSLGCRKAARSVPPQASREALADRAFTFPAHSVGRRFWTCS